MQHYTRTIDILSVPNHAIREGEGSFAPIAYWLRFDLNLILKASELGGASGYEPKVVADGVDLPRFESLLIENDATSTFSALLANMRAAKGGVSVYMHDTTLKKAINPTTLLKSLGSRFTVTMLKPDFVVSINGKTIKPEDAFPPFQEFGFGSAENPLTETLKIQGLQEIEWVI